MEQYVEHDGFWLIQSGIISPEKNPGSILEVTSNPFATRDELKVPDFTHAAFEKAHHRLMLRREKYSLNLIKDISRFTDRTQLYMYCEDQYYDIIMENLIAYLEEPYDLVANAHLVEQFSDPEHLIPQSRSTLKTNFWWCIDQNEPDDLEQIGDWIAFIGTKRDANAFCRAVENFYKYQWDNKDHLEQLRLIQAAYGVTNQGGYWDED